MPSGTTFVRLPNELTGAPPADALRATLQIMLLKGKKSAQQRYCDAALNSFADSAYRFSVVSDRVLITSIFVQEMRSLDPIEAGHGSVVESDIALWSLVKCMRIDGTIPDKLMWLPSFMFVDSGPAMATGREIFGYPKCVSEIKRAEPSPGKAGVEIKTVHFDEFAPTATAQNRPIMAVIKGPGLLSDPTDSTMAKVSKDFVKEYEPELKQGFTATPFPQIGMPQVTLRQFRDPTRAGAASLSEILVVTPQATKLRGVGFLEANLEVTLQKSASHDVMGLMGLGPVNKVDFGGWVTFDFRTSWAKRLYP